MKILLAVDGSPCSKRAVEEVAKRPWPANSKIRLITVRQKNEALEELSAIRAAEALPGQEDWHGIDFMTEAFAMLKASDNFIEIIPAVRTGRAKDSIIEDAEQWEADLIVIGSHGYGIVKHFLLGSVSLAVALNAHCSVEIVRTKADIP
ncbi:MAG: universal stress protein [Trichlorobacter sp.]|jgi:nucleotide-binding universal stress UspA family protein|nr:universal stress protein [Trichlorobacter sp.]